MYELLTLSNGVRIASEKVSNSRIASIEIRVGAGSRNEHYSERGCAHFIEHMLFKGTEKRTAAGLAEEMDAIGGQCNAFTGRECTCFYAHVMDSHLDRAIDILTDMFFHSKMEQSDIDSERNVILEELGMSLDSPEDQVEERLISACFPGALGHPILGTSQSLYNIDREVILNFKNREYTPDRIVVTLCGHFQKKHINRLSALFSVLPNVSAKAPEKGTYTVASTFKRKHTEQNQISLAWPGYNIFNEKKYVWHILSTVLGEGLSSRLFQSVRERNGLCYSIGSYTASFTDAGLFGISTAVGKEAEDKALHLIRKEVDEVREHGITDIELIRAKELLKSNLILSSESTASKMHTLGNAILQFGYSLPVDEIISKYEMVSLQDVTSVAQEILIPEKCSISAIGKITDEEYYSSIFR